MAERSNLDPYGRACVDPSMPSVALTAPERAFGQSCYRSSALLNVRDGISWLKRSREPGPFRRPPANPRSQNAARPHTTALSSAAAVHPEALEDQNGGPLRAH
eukprot:CAMPEP_0174376498 /NCGR_PEP_ID=MMETSP0811_2-20130205/118400_1 /TAXON_ID=73025 ORGANISM="Eutreptiella gymnastica-like, Strain CCMP1594" /NCGR_SAMPLE_ID=MMETSP0811_2 /ASSEMBLY_ACC=CAM_ASM_000667 /LENGTH=102 /DNA_ID=CAMNT_0015527727 /DNA_START=60 /DNA_END=366 /DNA_ORIENTATION=-